MNESTDHAQLKATTGEPVVDTRIDTTLACADLATNAVEALDVGNSFVLVANHDPIGISYMLKAEKPDQTSWDVLEDGPERWQVRIGRTQPAA